MESHRYTRLVLVRRPNIDPVLVLKFYYEMLYTIYSVPNMVLPFFGGMLVDRVFGGTSFRFQDRQVCLTASPVRFGGILFCAIITTGQAIWALGYVTSRCLVFSFCCS